MATIQSEKGLVTHRGLLEVDHFRDSAQRAQRRRVQVVADGDQGPHEGLGAAAALPSLAAAGGLGICAVGALVLSVVPAPGARAEQLEQRADGAPALSSA